MKHLELAESGKVQREGEVDISDSEIMRQDHERTREVLDQSVKRSGRK